MPGAKFASMPNISRKYRLQALALKPFGFQTLTNIARGEQGTHYLGLAILRGLERFGASQYARAFLASGLPVYKPSPKRH